jgi:hypothetical protein
MTSANPKGTDRLKTRCRIDGTIIRRHFKYVRRADVTGIQLRAKFCNELSGFNKSAGKLFFSTCAMLHEPRHHDILSLFILPYKNDVHKSLPCKSNTMKQAF